MKILKHWKIILAAVLVFAAGGVTGAVLSVIHFKHAFANGLSLEHWTASTMGILQKDLNLTPEQQPKVRAVVEQTGQQFKETFGQAFSVSATNLVVFWARIDKELTPEQSAIHRRKCQDFREKLKESLKVELPPGPQPQEPR